MGNHGLSVFPHHADVFGEYIIANQIETRPGSKAEGYRKTPNCHEKPAVETPKGPGY